MKRITSGMSSAPIGRRRSTPAATAVLGFVEVPATPLWPLPTSGIEIELQRPDGTRLRMHAPAPQLPLLGVVRAFLETA